MNKMIFDEYYNFKKDEILLAELYPKEYVYGSKACIYGAALNDGVINEEQYEAAKSYYGQLWNYTGD